MRNDTSLPRNFMARCVYSWLLVIFIYFFFTHTLLSQLASPPLTTVSSDNTYWLLHLLNIPQFLLENYWAAVSFDVLLVISCILTIIYPGKIIFPWITVAGCWIAYVAYCSAAGHHFAQIGFLITPIAFLVKNPIKFSLLWKLVRYWICLLYLCGGLYKIYYGGFFSETNMAEILRFMNAHWLFFRTGGMRSDAIYYLIENPGAAQWLYRIATILDLVMVLGFFTYRFDRWLLMALLLFHLGNYFLLHISFVEQSLIFAPFLPWHKFAGGTINTHRND